MAGMVSYSGAKQPRTYGAAGARNLASLFGSTSMQPISSTGAGFHAINSPAPPDALARVMQNGQDVFAQIAPATKATAPTAPSIQTAAPSSSTYQGIDLSTDPILMQIKAIGQRRVADANSAALAGGENALIGYGSVQVPPTLAQLYAGDTSNPIYGALNDANTASAAAANPDSTLALLARAHNQNNIGIDQAENAANLYYSSDHANRLGDEANAYRTSQAQAAQNLAQLLGQAYSGVVDAQNTASDQYINELPNAYNRSLSLAALTGGDGATAAPQQDSGSGTGNVFNPASDLATEHTVYYDPTNNRYSTAPPARGTHMVAY